MFPGKKMAGHLGAERVTTQNIEVVKTDNDRGLIMVRGSVPGSRAAGCQLRDAVKRKLPKEAPKPGAFRLPVQHRPAAQPAAKEQGCPS